MHKMPREHALWIGNCPSPLEYNHTEILEYFGHVGLPKPQNISVHRGTGQRENAYFCIAEFANAGDADVVLNTKMQWQTGWPAVIRLLHGLWVDVF
jgi:hypothetical protein